MSKIIIITRDSEYAKQDVLNEVLVNMMATKKVCPSSCFYGFESFCDKSDDGEPDIDFDKLYDKQNELKLPDNCIDTKRDWLNGLEEPLNLAIDDSLVDLFKKSVEDECNYMEMIEYDNNEIYLFFWNRTKQTVTETWRILALICKDCGIDFSNSEEEKNILYIHDDEWGKTGNEILIQEGIIKSETNKELLEQLKIKFTFVVSFQHNNAEGMYFRDILQCNFGKQLLNNRLADEEEKNVVFGDLREACINVLLKEKSEE